MGIFAKSGFILKAEWTGLAACALLASAFCGVSRQGAKSELLTASLLAGVSVLFFVLQASVGSETGNDDLSQGLKV